MNPQPHYVPRPRSISPLEWSTIISWQLELPIWTCAHCFAQGVGHEIPIEVLAEKKPSYMERTLPNGRMIGERVHVACAPARWQHHLALFHARSNRKL